MCPAPLSAQFEPVLCPHRAAPGGHQRPGAGEDDQGGHGQECPAVLQLVRLLLRHRGQRDPRGSHGQVSTHSCFQPRGPKNPSLSASQPWVGFSPFPSQVLAAASLPPSPPGRLKLEAGPSLALQVWRGKVWGPWFDVGSLQVLSSPRLLLQEAEGGQVQPPDHPVQLQLQRRAHHLQ